MFLSGSILQNGHGIALLNLFIHPGSERVIIMFTNAAVLLFFFVFSSVAGFCHSGSGGDSYPQTHTESPFRWHSTLSTTDMTSVGDTDVARAV